MLLALVVALFCHGVLIMAAWLLSDFFHHKEKGQGSVVGANYNYNKGDSGGPLFTTNVFSAPAPSSSSTSATAAASTTTAAAGGGSAPPKTHTTGG